MARKSKQTMTEKAILAKLGELGGQRVGDDDLVYEGRRFVLPESMDLRQAIRFLEQKFQAEEQNEVFHKTFQYRPWDGALAMNNTLKKLYGASGVGQTIQSFFGDMPPDNIEIRIGPDETTQVPWGHIALPMFEGTLMTGAARSEFGPLFRISIECKRKYRFQVQGLFIAIENELRTNSMYRGAAIDGSVEADFLDLRGLDPTKIVYTREVHAQLEANIWSLLKYTPTMRELGMPLKRAVLLEGPYGTGKSLAAKLTAKVATDNDWTFIVCKPDQDLNTTMQTARLYQPAVVFFEDVDVIAENGESRSVSKLLDMFDGITAKDTEILLVMTTNHVNRIHKGVLRPGRVDAVVHIGALDREGITNLITAVVPEKMLGNVDYDKVADAMTGFLPAFVKEAVDRAVRYAIARTGNNPDALETDDFVLAAQGLRPQLELMESAGEGQTPDAFSTILQGIISKTVDGAEFVDNDGDQYYRLRVANSN